MAKVKGKLFFCLVLKTSTYFAGLLTCLFHFHDENQKLIKQVRKENTRQHLYMKFTQRRSKFSPFQSQVACLLYSQHLYFVSLFIHQRSQKKEEENEIKLLPL